MEAGYLFQAVPREEGLRSMEAGCPCQAVLCPSGKTWTCCHLAIIGSALHPDPSSAYGTLPSPTLLHPFNLCRSAESFLHDLDRVLGPQGIVSGGLGTGGSARGGGASALPSPRVSGTGTEASCSMASISQVRDLHIAGE